jgi:predicted ATPase
MIHIKRIELRRFKGIEDLSCQLDDLTLLVGLNNSGKTSVLHAVYLVASSLAEISKHPNKTHPNADVRTVDLSESMSSLGVANNIWFSPNGRSDGSTSIRATLSNGLSVSLSPRAGGTFGFTLGKTDNIPTAVEPVTMLSEVGLITCEWMDPPGIVPSQEDMVQYPQFQSLLRQGKGSQLWRNSIFWAVQRDGIETFDSVKHLVKKFFPDIELSLPTLGISGSMPIQLSYRDRGTNSLDISLSGAGLRTFISLARILQQSTARVLVFDEPDAHLHSSQQAVILDLLMHTALQTGRQIVIATHSPELINRAPEECIRWIDRTNPAPSQAIEKIQALKDLGANFDIYMVPTKLPQRIVYVEGVTDRPFVEAIILWCRHHLQGKELPSTLVVHHRDGRFDAVALHSIARVAQTLNATTHIIGIRDRDYYYESLPAPDVETEHGQGWTLLTLPCKEFENLLCDPDILIQVFGEAPTKKPYTLQEISEIVDGCSENRELVNKWSYQIEPRIRDGLPKSLDPASKEERASDTFQQWSCDAVTRRRLVAGKELLKRVRQKLKEGSGTDYYPPNIMENLKTLSPELKQIAKAIFPEAAEVLK